MSDMFCFQCEQTAGGKGCTGGAGVCGKKADTSNNQDLLTGAMIGLAKTAQNAQPTDRTHKTIIEGLFITITNVSFDNESILAHIEKVNSEKLNLVNGIAAQNNYDMENLWNAHEDVRSL